MLLAHFSNLERSLYTAATYQYDNSPVGKKIKIESERLDNHNPQEFKNFNFKKRNHKHKATLPPRLKLIMAQGKINKQPVLLKHDQQPHEFI
jgi:hypothetical protein